MIFCISELQFKQMENQTNATHFSFVKSLCMSEEKHRRLLDHAQ